MAASARLAIAASIAFVVCGGCGGGGGSSTSAPSLYKGIGLTQTSDPDYPAIAFDSAGNTIGVRVANGRTAGAVYRSQGGKTMVLTLGSSGEPDTLAIGEYLFLFTNLTAAAVDVAVVGPAGFVGVERSVAVAALTNSATKAQALARERQPSRAGRGITRGLDAVSSIHDWFAKASTALDVYTCIVPALRGLNIPTFPAVTTSDAAQACGSLVLQVGSSVLPADYALLDAAGAGLAGYGLAASLSECIASGTADLYNCISALVAAYDVGEITGEQLAIAYNAGVALAKDAFSDEDPPTVPTGLSLRVVSQNEIDLTWEASTDTCALPCPRPAGLVGYVIYQGSSTAISGANSYGSTGLDPGTQYCYQVAAMDRSGNRSSASAPPVCATTLAHSGEAVTLLASQGNSLAAFSCAYNGGAAPVVNPSIGNPAPSIEYPATGVYSYNYAPYTLPSLPLGSLVRGSMDVYASGDPIYVVLAVFGASVKPTCDYGVYSGPADGRYPFPNIYWANAYGTDELLFEEIDSSGQHQWVRTPFTLSQGVWHHVEFRIFRDSAASQQYRLDVDGANVLARSHHGDIRENDSLAALIGNGASYQSFVSRFDNLKVELVPCPGGACN